MTGTLNSGSSAVDPLARRLAAAASDLDGCGASAPGSIDAGPATGVITSMVAAVTKAAAGLSQGLSAGGQGVTQAGQLVDAADRRSGSAFSMPTSGVTP